MLENEIEVIKDAYPELKCEINSISSYVSGRINIKPKSCKDFDLKVFRNRRKIKHFPPIDLDFEGSSNNDIKINISSEWLSVIDKEKLLNAFKDYSSEDCIILDYICFIEKDSLEFLYPKHVIEFNLEEVESAKILDFWIVYENDEINREFSESIITCCSCLIPKRGGDCIKTNCDHIFCKNCAREYFDSNIKQGLLELSCLECGKELMYHEVKLLMDSKTFERWDSLQLGRYLKINSINCPRCNYSVLKDVDKLGACSKCYYSFCVLCKKLYHGEVICPSIIQERKNQLMKSIEYVDSNVKPRLIDFIDEIGPELEYDAVEMEKKIKEKFDEVIEFFKALDERDAAEQDKLRSECKLCSTCGEAYIKFAGCNKMTCPSCGSYFCYLCSKRLSHKNPYEHFQITDCNLFEMF